MFTSLVALGASDSSIVSSRRKNADIVKTGSVVVNLNTGTTLSWMRYWTLAEGYLWGRGQKNNRNDHATFFSGAVRYTASPGEPKHVIDDGGVAGTLGVRMIDGKFYGIGGEAFAPDILDAAGAKPPYDDHHKDERDGIYMIPFGTVESALSGQWKGCCHGSWRDRHSGLVPKIMTPFHPGCQSSLDRTWQTKKKGSVHCVGNMGRHGVNCGCRFDTKASFVEWKGKVLLYTRQNLHEHGGRFTAVAEAPAPEGPWGELRLIELGGYSWHGDGNLYMFVVNPHPHDPNVLIALFPLNLGKKGQANGDGESFIGMSLSCDGRHWSTYTKLVWTIAKEGRTYDHPVDGLIGDDDGGVSFLMHFNVPGISPKQGSEARIVKYQLDKHAFSQLTADAKRELGPSQCADAPPSASTISSVSSRLVAMSHSILDRQDFGATSADDDGSVLVMPVGVAVALCACLCLLYCCRRAKAGTTAAPKRTAPAESRSRRAGPSSGERRIRTPKRSHSRLPSDDVDDAEVGGAGVRSAPRTGTAGVRSCQLDDDDDLSSDRWSLQETHRAKQAIAKEGVQSTKERFRALKSGGKASSMRKAADETELNQILDAVDL